MKKLVLLLILMCQLFVGQSQEVNKNNWVLIHERTATWCPFCGTWGWDVKQQILSQFANENVIFMAVHHSGDLMNPTSAEFGNNFGGSGQPLFFVDGVNINIASNNIATKLQETQWEIDYKKNETTMAGVGLKATLDQANQSLIVAAEVEFLAEVEAGDYYFGLYLLEDVLANQANRTGMQLHKNVLRRSLLDNVFNNPLQFGKIDQGTTFTFSTSTSGLTAAKENYRVVGIIWTKANNKYLFFNANMVDVEGVSSSSDVTKVEADFNVFQSESGSIVLNFNHDNFAKNSNIQVADISGKIITSTSYEGRTSQTINANFGTGVHVVSINDGKNIVSKKIVLQ